MVAVIIIHTFIQTITYHFYYLKCSPTTSIPIFHDPRPNALMTGLKQKDTTKLTYANEKVHYVPKPGSH